MRQFISSRRLFRWLAILAVLVLALAIIIEVEIIAVFTAMLYDFFLFIKFLGEHIQ